MMSLEGCVGIADDICISGATQEEHDQRLIALMEVAKSAGLVFNSTKCSINQSSISFFSNVYSAAGIGPDPTKVRDINEMPVPQDIDDLQRFLRMIHPQSQPVVINLTGPLRKGCSVRMV